MFAGEPFERTDSEVSNASTEPELQGPLLPPREEWPHPTKADKAPSTSKVNSFAAGSAQRNSTSKLGSAQMVGAARFASRGGLECVPETPPEAALFSGSLAAAFEITQRRAVTSTDRSNPDPNPT
eukprot:scaffold34263_cov42-Phaeocystis_antarctica.AAC.3